MKTHTRATGRVLGAVAVALSLLVATGCVTRTLVIRSQPAGAQVYLDGREVGTTPLEMPFTWYGTREAILFKPAPTPQEVRDRPDLDQNAYRLRTSFELVRPGYQTPGVDLISDLLWPRDIEDRQEFDFVLEPVPTTDADPDGPEAQALRERADAARARAEQPSSPPTEGSR